MKKADGAAALLVIALGLSLQQTSCMASEADDIVSTGRLQLLPNQSMTEPREPTNPRIAEDTEDGNAATGNAGPLSLDVVPEGFYFGKQNMYHQAHDYQALSGTAQYVQVTDNRDAGVCGWTLKVKQDDALTNTKDGYQLKGAYLQLPVGIATSTNAASANHEDQQLLTQGVIVTDEDQTFFQAPADSELNAGKGTSIDYWASSDVVLHIPKDTARAGEYTNKLYWILSTEITN